MAPPSSGADLATAARARDQPLTECWNVIDSHGSWFPGARVKASGRSKPGHRLVAQEVASPVYDVDKPVVTFDNEGRWSRSTTRDTKPRADHLDHGVRLCSALPVSSSPKVCCSIIDLTSRIKIPPSSRTRVAQREMHAYHISCILADCASIQCQLHGTSKNAAPFLEPTARTRQTKAIK